MAHYQITIKWLGEPMLTFLWNIYKDGVCEITQLRVIDS